MIHIESLLHTFSPYANRWGGPRYRTTELLKYFNKYLYALQIENLVRHNKEINTSLASEAFLSIDHKPYYMRSLKIDNMNSEAYEIEDELGFKAIFPKGTEILMYHPQPSATEEFSYTPIEKIKPGDERVINFERVPKLRNDTLHHHRKFSEGFLRIKCKSEKDLQIILCDAITSMMMVEKIDNLRIKRLDVFNKKNSQEIYLIEILNVKKLDAKIVSYKPTFFNFSHIMIKDKKHSVKSKDRYYKAIKKTLPKKILEKMRKSVFYLKSSNTDFNMELIHEENRD